MKLSIIYASLTHLLVLKIPLLTSFVSCALSFASLFTPSPHCLA